MKDIKIRLDDSNALNENDYQYQQWRLFMLSDFLTLEAYFGSPESALYFEDLSKRYGPVRIWQAVKEGDLICRTPKIGPDQGRLMAWLSDQGRKKALATTL
jgi:hypothetical protein